MPDGPFRPGDKVPITGIYSVSHYQHRMPHEVFAVAGDTFPQCRRCGTRASFTLLQAAVHIDADQDFSGSAERAQVKARANSQKED
jgi:hypothetical protein